MYFGRLHMLGGALKDEDGFHLKTTKLQKTKWTTASDTGKICAVYHRDLHLWHT